MYGGSLCSALASVVFRFPTLCTERESAWCGDWDSHCFHCSVVDDFQKVWYVVVIVNFGDYEVSVQSSVDVSVSLVNLVGRDEGRCKFLKSSV